MLEIKSINHYRNLVFFWKNVKKWGKNSRKNVIIWC